MKWAARPPDYHIHPHLKSDRLSRSATLTEVHQKRRTWIDYRTFSRLVFYLFLILNYFVANSLFCVRALVRRWWIGLGLAMFKIRS